MNQKTQRRQEIKSLKFENLSFRYNDSSSIFEDISFDFPLDQITCFKSYNTGAGRSTLMQLLAGLETANDGKYLINDLNVNEMSFEEFLPFRLSIGYAFDTGGLIHNKTIAENLILPLLYHNFQNPTDAENKVNSYLNTFGIAKYKDQRPSSVQGSVRKIACLIRPLLLEPQMLLLDDPSVGIPQETALKYFDFVNELRQKKTIRHIFISSNDEKFMGLMEHTEIFLDQGQFLHEVEGTGKKVVHL